VSIKSKLHCISLYTSWYNISLKSKIELRTWEKGFPVVLNVVYLPEGKYDSVEEIKDVFNSLMVSKFRSLGQGIP